MQKLLATALVSAFALIQAPAFAQDKPTEKKAEPAKAEAKKAEPAKAEPAKAEAKKAEPAKADATAPAAKKDEQKKPKKGGC
jgi:hypothetical protein